MQNSIQSTNKSPIEEIHEFLATCWKYGFLHTESDQVINTVMYQLWSADLGEDDEFDVIPDTSEMFNMIDEQEKKLFVKDLINLVGLCLTSKDPLVPSVIVRKVQQMRV